MSNNKTKRLYIQEEIDKVVLLTTLSCPFIIGATKFKKQDVCELIESMRHFSEHQSAMEAQRNLLIHIYETETGEKYHSKAQDNNILYMGGNPKDLLELVKRAMQEGHSNV